MLGEDPVQGAVLGSPAPVGGSTGAGGRARGRHTGKTGRGARRCPLPTRLARPSPDVASGPVSQGVEPGLLRSGELAAPARQDGGEEPLELRPEAPQPRGRRTMSGVPLGWPRPAGPVRAEDVAIPVETDPGEIVQVDFGYLDRLYDPILGVLRRRVNPVVASAPVLRSCAAA